MAFPKFTVNQLEFLFTEYLEDIKTKGYSRPELIKSGDLAGTVINVLVPKPLTIDGFLLFIKMGSIDFYNYINYKPADNEDINDFKVQNKLKIQSFLIYVRMFIQEYQIGGAAANILNPMIISRINGLTEKIEQTTNQPSEVINIIIDGTKLDLS